MVEWFEFRGQHMRAVIVFCSVVVVICAALSRSIDKLASMPSRPAPMAAVVSAPPSANAGMRSTTLQADAGGHFQVEARVDGRYLNFMVDTGASVIALRESSAARLGIFPTPRDYTMKTQTANGVGRAARVQLNQVEVNGITVRNVEAFVVPDDNLSMNLLGMSFLSRVKWTHDRGRLVLEQ